MKQLVDSEVLLELVVESNAYRQYNIKQKLYELEKLEMIKEIWDTIEIDKPQKEKDNNLTSVSKPTLTKRVS